MSENKLEVFAFKSQAVVDSREVARATERRHDHLLRSIQAMIGHMEHASIAPKIGANDRRKIAVSDFFIPSTYTDDIGRTLPCYLCTRLGCDMIANKMTGEKGTLFTAAYVSRFREMEKELAQREVQRAIKAPVRRSLTDAIKDSGEDERMHGHAFAAYTNLVYKSTVGMTAPQLRKAAGVDRGADTLALLDAEQLASVCKREAQVCALLECGMQYEEIRAIVLRAPRLKAFTGRGTKTQGKTLAPRRVV